MSNPVELRGGAQKLHELLLLSGSDGLGEVRRLAAVGVSGVDAEHATVLGRKVAGWSVNALGDELTQAFDLDAMALLAQGWSQVRKVARAVRDSRGTPPRPQTVALVKHDLEARVQPRLVLQLGGVDWCDIELDLSLKLSVEAAQLEFLGGDLVSLTLARPTGSLTLKCEGQEVAAFKRSLTLRDAYKFEPPLRWPALPAGLS